MIIIQGKDWFNFLYTSALKSETQDKFVGRSGDESFKGT